MFKFNKLLLIIASISVTFGALSSTAYAGTGWYMSITNNTNEPFKVESSGADCWYSNGISQDKEVPAHKTVQIYSEVKNSGSCNKFFNGSWVQGFKLMAGDNFQNQVLNAIQTETWDGHFGQCSVGAQAGYRVAGKSISCGPASSTIKYAIDVSMDSSGYLATVTSMECTGSLSCDL